jgi:hypothetical protein
MREMITTISTGIRLLWTQTQWSIMEWMRRREIQQLQKRLNEEYLRIGQAVYHKWKASSLGDTPEEGIQVALRQVDFLLDEIQHLEEALTQDKQRYFQEKGLTPSPREEN